MDWSDQRDVPKYDDVGHRVWVSEPGFGDDGDVFQPEYLVLGPS